MVESIEKGERERERGRKIGEKREAGEQKER